MLGNTYPNIVCSAARALEIVGERWSLLILRDSLFRGVTQFSEFQRSLGIATNILARRLEVFVENGLLDYVPARSGREPSAYVPTPKAMDLKPVIMALTQWGDRWMAPDGPPVSFHNRSTGAYARLRPVDEDAGDAVPLADIVARPAR
jgi:DNA-binding HxlR family transcriptional regulator